MKIFKLFYFIGNHYDTYRKCKESKQMDQVPIKNKNYPLFTFYASLSISTFYSLLTST